MSVVFDIAKNRINIANHGVPLTVALGFRARRVFEDDGSTKAKPHGSRSVTSATAPI